MTLPSTSRPRTSTIVASTATVLFMAAVLLAGGSGGTSLPIASVIPVATWAWAFATRGGLFAALAATAVNTFIAVVISEEQFGQWLAAGGGAGSSAILGIGLLVGWLRGTRLALERELSKRLAAQVDLERLHQLNSSILASTGEGIVALDARGHIVSINPAGARLLGIPLEAAVDRHLEAIVDIETNNGTGFSLGDTSIAQTLADGAARTTVGDRFTRHDGSSVIVDRVVTPLREEPHGEVNGIVMALRDTTARAQLEQTKSQFLAMTSHELKTPLTAIHATLGLTTSGVVGEVPTKVKELLTIASQNSDRLLKLINEIVELERINLGGAAPDLERCRTQDLLSQVATSVEPLALESDVTINVQCVDVGIDVDRDRIAQTITNLASNAIKFSPAGSEVLLACHTSPEEVVFEVRDAGHGITADQLDRIFEPFVQVNTTDASVLGGSGLGLAISRGIVEQHHGRIWAESEPGHGSTFFFALPLPA